MTKLDVENTSRARRYTKLIGTAIIIAVSWILVTRPAFAIVFQSAAAQTAGLGAGHSFLDGQAKLLITRSDNSLSGCSGSLLSGGTYVLTAAHCLAASKDSPSTSSISMTFGNVGLTITSTTYIVDPTWNGDLRHGGDLALIALANPVTTINGYQLNLGQSAVGKAVTLSGYGTTGTGSTGADAGSFGTLYYAMNTYLGTYSDLPSVYDYTFNSTGSLAAMIASGDSGGGSLIYQDGVWQIVGVHDFVACLSSGCSATSTFGNYGGDTSVYANAGFLNAVLVPEPPTVLALVSGFCSLVILRRLRSRRVNE